MSEQPVVKNANGAAMSDGKAFGMWLLGNFALACVWFTLVLYGVPYVANGNAWFWDYVGAHRLPVLFELVVASMVLVIIAANVGKVLRAYLLATIVSLLITMLCVIAQMLK